MTDKVCHSCHRQIDAAAKACPFCGADPASGIKVELKPLVESHFPPRPRLSTLDRGLQAIRARQGVVVTIVTLAAALLLGALYQYIARRNQQFGNDIPPVPLTEITDAAAAQPQELPLPDMKFSYDGNPRTLQTYLVEPGAIAPAPPPGAAPLSPQAGTATPRGAMPAPASPNASQARPQ